MKIILAIFLLIGSISEARATRAELIEAIHQEIQMSIFLCTYSTYPDYIKQAYDAVEQFNDPRLRELMTQLCQQEYDE